MPFQSKAQAKWMFANHPAMAKRWAAVTPSIKALPDHVQGGTVAKKQSNFDKLASKLAQRPGVTNPKALAAYIGDKKYGKAGMAAKAARAR